MKPVAIMLFLLGCFWALLAWAFVLMPIGILIPSYHFQAHDVISSLIASTLSLVGYFVWFGWGFYWKNTRFPLLANSSFWMISLALHVLWLLAFPFLLETTYEELLKDTAMTCYLSWISINICLAAIFVTFGNAPNGQQKPTHNKA
jgi:hypothetical protein